ncbi:MAG: zf-HC2 domain-containing protein [Elusimicrobia bacterium]|nr:zf-HC2 domain-containing protein [Elusimicrobiota bacterium]
MGCEGWTDLLSAYADRETSPEESAQVEAHAAGCRSCGRRLAIMAKSKEVLSRLPLPEAPRDLKEALLRQAARVEGQGRTGLSFAERLAAWLSGSAPRYGLAFGLAAFLLVGLWIERRQDEPVPLDLMLSAHRQYAETAVSPASVPAGADEELEEEEGDE